MSEQEFQAAHEAYRNGRLSRRRFVQFLMAGGVSVAAAGAFAESVSAAGRGRPSGMYGTPPGLGVDGTPPGTDTKTPGLGGENPGSGGGTPPGKGNKPGF